ncbi:hypothetical protein PS854_05428 [Pseudomonas fluorescens]|uniref:Uncharacterized protein n=1 Tax=Pseudomonas fluorescens TaxID=294 RepID=A0A5E7PU73_PSEFL|nr:hypothetical protein PS854_05428 [Pseudomonas fluorescens]
MIHEKGDYLTAVAFFISVAPPLQEPAYWRRGQIR